MYISPQSTIGQLLHRFTVRRWRGVERDARTTTLPRLARQRTLALRLIRPLRRFIDIADARLAAPVTGTGDIAVPTGSDWAWRPKPWRNTIGLPGLTPDAGRTEMTRDVVLFHDCTAPQITLRQVPNKDAQTAAPFGLALDVLNFTGSYLSLVVEVQADACKDLRKRHLLQLATEITRTYATPITARLNLRHGPNVEQIQLVLPERSGPITVAFDLAYTQLNEKRAEAMWIDLMIARPRMNAIRIHDLTLARYPRADVG